MLIESGSLSSSVGLAMKPLPLQVAMVAGEASGDLLAGLLLDGMKAKWPSLVASGIGGPHMQARGFNAWWPHDKLAVHGYSWEVLRRYREIVGIRSELKARLLQSPPSIFVGVDAPDFNLDLEADLRAAGVKTVHFVAPSVWAWRPERVEKIKRSVDHVLCIFPFEPALLAQHGIESTYVGHPLANVIPMLPDRCKARAALGLDDNTLGAATYGRGMFKVNVASGGPNNSQDLWWAGQAENGWGMSLTRLTHFIGVPSTVLHPPPPKQERAASRTIDIAALTSASSKDHPQQIDPACDGHAMVARGRAMRIDSFCT